MSLDFLAELVSVTSDAVKSLNNKSGPNITSEKMQFLNAGSPFLSPRSFKSVSDKSEHHQKPLTKDVIVNNNSYSEHETCDTSPSISNEIQIAENSVNSVGQGMVDRIIDILPCDIVNGSESKARYSDQYDENINNSNRQKFSISKKQLREIISPREVPDHISCSSQSHESSKYSVNSSKKTDPFLPVVSKSKKKFIVERHEPVSDTVNINNNRIIGGEIEAESDDSCIRSDDQPGIIDVHEKIIAITSGVSESSDDLKGTQKMNEVPCEPEKNGINVYHKILSSENEARHSVKQGALKNGSVDPTKNALFNDVYISQFSLTERQRILKEALAKRSETNKPKKKLVQPQIIQRKGLNDPDSDKSATNKQLSSIPTISSATDPVITAAAAASAAVAAAQPFLKTQQELETKMQRLLTQLAELQQRKDGTHEEGKSSGSDNRILDLEHQVAELNERRFEHLENLQQQQMQMQAQLLYLSQARNHNSLGYRSNTHVSPARQLHNSRIPQAVANHPVTSSLKTDFVTYNPTSQDQPTYSHNLHRKPFFNPATLSQHHNYLSEVRELQGSHLDTPAPRNKVPKPTPYILPKEPPNNLGFLEELLASKDVDKDSTFNVKGDHFSPSRLTSDWSNSSRVKRGIQSPVDKARQLVTSLSNLEKETADSLWDTRSGIKKTSKMDVDLGPAPLDQYLKYPEKEGSPYPKLSHHSRKSKKMLDTLDNLLEAKNILRHLEVTRETLEANLDQVVRSRRDMHVFSTLLGAGADSPADDQLRIEKLVNKKISAMEGDVQREVLKSLAQAEAEKLAAQQQLELAAKLKLDQARSGVLKGQAQRNARLAYSKPNVLTTATLASKGKENKESTVKPPPKTVAIKDEATRVRTYGKPEYQRGRTTIRDPYLHFKNPKKGVAAKSSVTNLNESARSREDRLRSPPSKQYQEPVIDHMPKQFYFSPTRGYVALGAGDTAPIQGQLVSMAVPLGAPRLEPGIRKSAVPVIKCSTDPVSSTPVTAARNVAMVSFPVGGGRQTDYERQPELVKQVLPPIDIDSISPSSSQRSGIHIRSPQHDNANVTFLFDTQNEMDSDLNKTLTEESSDLEQSGEGIKLPGYDPKTAEYSGLSFPPRLNKPGPDWVVRGDQSVPVQSISNVLAEDLRRRDLLENNAVVWLEQELMARILSQVPHRELQQTGNISKAESEEASDWNESLLVADVIGQDGMQLFIDAGQPVNNVLVQELVKEVIKEKIMSLMSQRIAEGEGQSDQVRVVEARKVEQIAADPYRVPTPEPTPKTSPIPFLVQKRQQPPQPVTPPQSPPADGYRFKHIESEPVILPEPVRQLQTVAQPSMIVQNIESESEVSLSLDISEELQRVAAKDKSRDVEEQTTVCYDVATPPISPSPLAEEEEFHAIPDRQATPSFTSPMIKTPPPPQTLVREKEPVSQHEKEEEMFEQPQPIMMSVGVGDSRPMTAEIPTQHRSPSPKRPMSPVSTSETSTSSVETSSTETVNEFISEGQWLLSYSEGQMVGPVNYDAIRKSIAGKGYQHIIDVSTASTLRDTEDLDLDIECTKSEGEFICGGVLDPDKDLRLEVLAGLVKRPTHVNQIPIGPASIEAMFNTGRSIGEMSIGQVPPSKLAMDRARRYGEHGQQRRRSSGVSPSSSMERNMKEVHDHMMERQDRRHSNEKQQRNRTQSSLQEYQSRTPSPQQQGNAIPSQHSRTPSPQQQQRNKTPPQNSQRSRTQSQRHSESSGSRPRAQMPYQPVLSEGRPLTARGRNVHGPRGSHQSSDSRISQSSDPGVRRSGSVYHSESLSRSADSEVFGQGNGFLTSSLKSRQSSIKKSVEFDLRMDKSSKMAPRDSLEPNNSFGLAYTEASLDESELRRISSGTTSNVGTYRMSVTIPSVVDGEESEFSEIDISNKSDK